MQSIQEEDASATECALPPPRVASLKQIPSFIQRHAKTHYPTAKEATQLDMSSTDLQVEEKQEQEVCILEQAPKMEDIFAVEKVQKMEGAKEKEVVKEKEGAKEKEGGSEEKKKKEVA